MFFCAQYGFTPFHIGVARGHISVLQILIRHLSYINETTDYNDCKEDHSISNACNYDTIEHCIWDRNNNGHNSLIISVLHNQIESLSFLVNIIKTTLSHVLISTESLISNLSDKVSYKYTHRHLIDCIYKCYSSMVIVCCILHHLMVMLQLAKS